MPRKSKKIIIILALFTAIAALYFVLHSKNIVNNPQEIPSLPVSQNQPEKSTAPEPKIPSEENIAAPAAEEKTTPEEQPEKNIPAKFLLDMPFYSQAPLSKWDAFHEEMCEEASILNAGLYLEGKKLTKDQFEAELQKIQKIEKDTVGAWKSTTVAETKKWTDVYFAGKIKTKIIENPTVEDIEREIAAGLPAGASAEVGHPVVAPLAGRDIGNPNFTPPGPVYHMLAIKGFDAQNFITNDVGTRKGNSYTYKKTVIMENIHDWNEKDIRKGAQRIIVLYK